MTKTSMLYDASCKCFSNELQINRSVKVKFFCTEFMTGS